VIPYTHWAYFDSPEQASSCGSELATKEFLVDVTSVDSDADGADRWLLRAAKPVPIGHMVARRDQVEAVVERHGGIYDGGESGWLDLDTGTYLQQEPPSHRPGAHADPSTMAAKLDAETHSIDDHQTRPRRIVLAGTGATVAIALAVFSLAGAIRLGRGPAVLVVEAAVLLVLGAQLWWLRRTRHRASMVVREQQPRTGQTTRRQVLVWTCWSTGVLIGAIGPMTTLLTLDQEVAAVSWFALAVLAVVLTGPAARRWLEHGLGTGQGI
jgi:hypothetical protein